MASTPKAGTDWQLSAPVSLVTHPNPRAFIYLDPFDERATFANVRWLALMGYKDHDLIRH